MNERPIPFSAPMVRSVLDDTKNQTRRVCKPAQFYSLSSVVEVPDPLERGQVYNGSHFGDEEGDVQFASPYGQPGDRLWVRETFFAFGRWETRYSAKKARDEWHFVDMTLEAGHQYAYPADGHRIAPHRRTAGVTPTWWKRPAIHMPHTASRILLEVTGVRVEPLQDISEADAIAEGIEADIQPGDPAPLWRNYATGNTTISPVYSYQTLWEQINGPGSWDSNPWVWVVEFRRLQ